MVAYPATYLSHLARVRCRVQLAIHLAWVSDPEATTYDDVRMLRYLLLRLIAVAVALAVTAWIIPDVDITGGLISVLGVAVLFGIVDALLGPILRILTLPLNVLTLGLFTLVVNGILLAVVAGLSSHLQVGGFLSTILAALVLSIVAGIIDLFFGRAFLRSKERKH
jgi:putative membrane protein